MSFYSSYFSFLSQGVLFSAVETPLYLYFIAFVVPSKFLMKLVPDLDFYTRTDFSSARFSRDHFLRHDLQ